MDGRVKTLHPSIHGALLGRRDVPSHVQAMQAHGITPIDLVCVNLYPFERMMNQPGATRDEVIEQIDIGGPAMLRSAAKNHAFVTVVTAADQYDRVISDMKANHGATSAELRRDLREDGVAHVRGERGAAHRRETERQVIGAPEKRRPLVARSRVDEHARQEVVLVEGCAIAFAG